MALENLLGGMKNFFGKVGITALLSASLLFGGCERKYDTDPTYDITQLNAAAGDREVSLTWKNATALEAPGARVLRKIDDFPLDENDGTVVYQGEANSFTDTGLEHSILYCYRVFAFSLANPPQYTTGQTSSATPFDATPPGNVTNLSTVTRPNEVELQWTNPTDSDFVDLILVRKQDAYPADENDGTIIYQGSGESLTDIGLTEDEFYTYAFFTFDDSRNRSYRFKFLRKTDNITAVGWIGAGSDFWQDILTPASGSDLRSFNSPSDILLDENGNLYIADTRNHRIVKRSNDGVTLGWLGGGTDGWQTGSGASAGTDAYSFNSPVKIIIDSDNGDLYIADRDNNRIVRRDSNGNLIGWIGCGVDGWQTGSGNVATEDYRGFKKPCGLYIRDGNIYVADTDNNRITKWRVDGTAIGWMNQDLYVSGWQTSSYSPGIIPNRPKDLIVSITVPGNNESLYVLDNDGIRWRSQSHDDNWFMLTERIENASGWTSYFNLQFTQGNKAVKRIWTDLEAYSYSQIYFASFGGGSDGWKTGSELPAGSDSKSLNNPVGIFVDTTNNIFYIADKGNHRISKWKD